MSRDRIIRGAQDEVAAVALPPVSALATRGRESAERAADPDAALREAEQRGWAACEAALRAELDAERAGLAEQRTELARVIERLGHVSRDVLEADAVEVITLALELCREVLAAELVLPRQRIEAWVKRVVEQRSLPTLTVKLAPSVTEEVADALRAIGSAGGTTLVVEVDASLEPYDVVIELGPGVLDLTVRGAFERVLHELKEIGQ